MEELYRQIKARFDAYHQPAHDFKHVLRVSRFAKIIAEAEGYDVKEAEVAGLLHDIGRSEKPSEETHAHAGAPIAKELLDTYSDFSEEAKERIVQAVYLHSDPITEGKLNHIVQDADKLDGMGAIGVNRAYIARYDKPDYDADDVIPSPGIYNDIKTTHHLMTLILDWYTETNTEKPRLYSQKAHEIAKPRYEFMKAFLEEFKREVEETR